MNIEFFFEERVDGAVEVERKSWWARGTELVVEHIETMWCPSILSDDLTRVVPGSADPEGSAGVRRTASVR